MALSAGARLGPYEVVAAIGAGGMGEVYRAARYEGEHFLMVRYEPAAIPTRINVILDWTKELERLVPSR